ncbi:hypothetical protein N9A94_03985 [Akkermansiaceae bacterium]|nr:hypothetical protein [Akkermansiaceae bacterium]
MTRQVEQSSSTSISSIDPMGEMDFAARKARRAHCFGDLVMIVVFGAIAAGLAYWAWSRGARWSFAAAAIGFIPGSVVAMGIYRDTIRQLCDILREIPGFDAGNAVTQRDLSVGDDLPAGVLDALEQLRDEHPNVVGLIRDEVILAIQDTLPEVHRQLNEGLITPRDVARQFSCNVAGDQLEGGRHHIYRGTLTDAGRLLLSFYSTCWWEDAERGFTTEDKADEEIAAMQRIVREIG